MQPTITFDRAVVAVRVEDTVHVMLELTAPDAVVTRRTPIDTVVVIDRSGSMHGAPLEAVTRATAQLLRLIGPEDRIGVVAFDDSVDLVLPLGHHDPVQAGDVIRGIPSGGSTNLSGGWLKALEMLSMDRRPGAITRIVLLTDGMANLGVTDLDQLTGLSAAAQAQGVSTSCIGFGDSYDERLLAAMADAGAGNDYWCAGPDQAAAVFNTEFGGLANVVAQNLSVELRPNAQVQSWLVLNEYPTTYVPGGIQVALGDAYGGEQRRVVAMLQIHPQADTGSVQVAEMVIRWASVGSTMALHTVVLPVTIEVGGDADAVPANPAVTEQVTVLHVSKRRAEASEAAQSGDYETASKILASAAELLISGGGSAQEAEELLSDAAELAQRRWDLAAQKRMFSTNRQHHKQRKSRFDDTEATDS